MAVFVLDKHKKPLMPCSEKRARILLERGRARVHKMVPFTIRLVDRLLENSTLQPTRVKLDPGSKTTGIALVRESEIVDEEIGEILRKVKVLMLLELQHRGSIISKSLEQRAGHRRFRRAKLRYRPARFNNRTKPKGWLAPSLQHRVDTTVAWVHKLMKLAPVTALSQELVRFDTQQMQNPEISGMEYQQGTLLGYEVREYLLEKWDRKCSYCGAENVPMEVDHIHPKSRGGSNRVSNLTLACHNCNQSKGSRDVAEFLAHDPQRLALIEARRKVPLRDAATINSTRWALWRKLSSTNLPVEVGTGGRTKYNRRRLEVPKEHCLDAACVGHVDILEHWQQPVLNIKATGRGRYQRTCVDKYGFPRSYFTRNKSAFGFQTGDMAKAVVTTGKKVGVYSGRIVISARGYFDIHTEGSLIRGLSSRFFTLVQRGNGYGYSLMKGRHCPQIVV